MAKRTTKEFSRTEIWEIATRYANTGLAYSHEFFEKEYTISRSTFYAILEKAVIESCVDMNIVKKMTIKASSNSEKKAGIAGKKRSEKHYEELIHQRARYMLPKKDAINWTIKYAETNLPKEAFSARYHIDKKLLERTIHKAVLENWVSDEMVEMIKTKSMRNNHGEGVKEFWKELIYFRDENKKNQG